MLLTKRAICALVVAAAFGAAAGALKGDDGGLRGAVGNLSAPWLLVGFLPSIRCSNAWRGALMGLVSTLVALAAFYVVLTVVLSGHLGGGGYRSELLSEAGANRVYFVAGMVTGPLMGAVAAWFGRRHASHVWLVVGGLLAGEVVAVAVFAGHQLAPRPFYFVWGVDDWRPYIAESLLGMAVVVAAIARPGWQHRTELP